MTAMSCFFFNQKRIADRRTRTIESESSQIDGSDIHSDRRIPAAKRRTNRSAGRRFNIIHS
jgi:hypothetical protein